MGSEQREEFERRILALVRRQLDFMDDDYPHGYEIGDFVITWRFHSAPEPGAALMPWHGGPYPGWDVGGYTSGSSTSYLIDEEILLDALDNIQARRASDDSDGDG